MPDDITKKAASLAGATAVVFGGAFGVSTSEAAKQNLATAQSFKEKLSAIQDSVEKGEIKPFVVDGNKWIFNEKRDVEVAQWSQTWQKIDWKKQS
ncbi:hypothetical protein K9U33_20485 [Rhodoblastus acidophilus]|uniref:hypothetical protein n=1 Tax=Candidatus Rhodoblastus alkanivorans TaxID=2954117 RepID=UPI001FA9DA63|nr:hypothetical protein [Candidatus Rhodoblastus alkanivorans]MCI4680976.1 hypothetical protein [Candidatus Rhodoblastus alkanivorans]